MDAVRAGQGGRGVVRPQAPRTLRRGLTLIEMLVVLGLLAVFVTLAVPSFARFVAGQRVGSLAHELTSDLLFARSEALKRNAAVTVTPREGGWGAGWVVASGGNELLARQASRGAPSFAGAPSAITFGTQGRVAAPASAVRITVGDSAHEVRRRCVELDLAGRARTKAEACS